MSQISPRELIAQIYATNRVSDENGNTFVLHSSVDPREGEFIAGLIESDESVLKTLEIGCAYGLSSLHICSALNRRSDGLHIIIDPAQHTEWSGVGVANLRRAGLENFKLVEEDSALALPAMLNDHEGTLDLVFVDGWHTFDHTLVDCFYATRLLKVGGILVVDDVGHRSVGRAVSFIASFPCYEKIGKVGSPIGTSRRKELLKLAFRPLRRTLSDIYPAFHARLYADVSPTMIALRKVSEDQRNWDWHCDAF